MGSPTSAPDAPPQGRPGSIGITVRLPSESVSALRRNDCPPWLGFRIWATPRRPSDGALPRTRQEIAYWNKWVAEGWAQGEKQAVEIFLSDLGRLERDMIGMARYRVLLRARLVEQPRVAFNNVRVDGGRDSLHVDDRTIRITDQPGLQGNARRWAPGAGCPQ